LVASACADASAPQAVTCDVNNPNVCH